MPFVLGSWVYKFEYGLMFNQRSRQVVRAWNVLMITTIMQILVIT